MKKHSDMKKHLFVHIFINFLETQQNGRLEKVPFELENNKKRQVVCPQ